MTIDQMIEVLQAAKQGKRIEYKQGDSCWLSLPEVTEYWDFVHNTYRVKREPRIVYCNEYPDGSLGLPVHSTAGEVKAIGRGMAKVLRFVEAID